jgi:CheY-like chemotaxis protein
MVCLRVARLPWTFVDVGHGIETLAVVQRDRPHLILLDIVVPRLDGWAVLQTLQAEGLTPDLPVLLS